jgi:hypothetical protein
MPYLCLYEHGISQLRCPKEQLGCRGCGDAGAHGFIRAVNGLWVDGMKVKL